MNNLFRTAAGAAMVMGLLAAAEAATFTIDGNVSHAKVTTNWYTPLDILLSQPDAVPAAQATVTGRVDATLALNASPPGKLLSYGGGTSIAIGTHSAGLDIFGATGTLGHLQVTLAGLALKPDGSVLLDYAQGTLPGWLPVDIAMAMGTPTLTYQFTSPQGDVLGGGSANLWRYSPSVMVWSRLTSSGVGANDEYLGQSMSVALSIPNVSFSNGTGLHNGTLEYVIEPDWMATLNAPVPEPAGWALSLAGLLALAVLVRKQHRHNVTAVTD